MPVDVFQSPFRMKLLSEPCGPQGLPFSPPFGTTEVLADTPDPWQSVQYIVCVPTALRQGRFQRLLMFVPLPRIVPVRPVLSITGCQERWLFVVYCAPAPESVVVVWPRCSVGAWNSRAWFVCCCRLFVPEGVPGAPGTGRLPSGYTLLSL